MEPTTGSPWAVAGNPDPLLAGGDCNPVSPLAGSNPSQWARFVDLGDWPASVLEYEEAVSLLDDRNKAGEGSSQAAGYQPAAGAQDGDSEEESDSRLRVCTPPSPYASSPDFLQSLPEIEETTSEESQLATPEPANWWMLLAGVALIGMSCVSKWWGRRRSHR